MSNSRALFPCMQIKHMFSLKDLSARANNPRQRQSTSLWASKQSTWSARNSLGFVIRRQVERTYLSGYRRTFWIDVGLYSKHATLVSSRRRQSFNLNTHHTHSREKTMNCTERKTFHSTQNVLIKKGFSK